MSKRTVTKKIETRVKFSNDEIVQILIKSVNGPDNAGATTYSDGDAYYGDLELVWWETKTEELD